MKRNKKRTAILFVLTISILNLIYPPRVFSESDRIEFSSNETNLIIGSLYQEILNEWVSFSVGSGNPKEEAVLAVLRRTIKTSGTKYLLTQAPKEIVIDFIKIGKKISAIVSDPSLSSFVKFGTEELKKMIIEELIKDEIRIGGGNLSVSYYSTMGIAESAIFPYILAYNPKSGRAEINIYSLNNIKAPQPTLGNPWSGGVHTLSPFVVNISGTIKKLSSGYSWKSSKIDIKFTNNIPSFTFRELSFLEKQLSPDSKTLIVFKKVVELMGGAEEKAIDLWNRLKGAIGSASGKGLASIYSIIRGPSGDETLVLIGKDDESAPAQSNQQSNYSELFKSESGEIQKLLKIIDDLEKSSGITSLSSRVEINTASKENLMRIVHIGSARADEIIRLRPFSSLDDLLRVSGIGVKILADIKEQGLAYVEGEFINTIYEKEEIPEIPKKEDACGKPVNINTATLKELTCLTGIGEVIAQRIIDYRKNTPFQSLDDLLNVNGIGLAVLNKIKEQGLAYVEANNLPNNPAPSTNDPKDNPETCLPESIELNTASKKDLMLIYGIGEAKAQNIMNYREQNTFYSLDDLLNVSGIGSTTLNKIKEQNCAFVNTSSPSPEDISESDEIVIIGAENVFFFKVSYPSDLAFKDVIAPQELNDVYINQEEFSWNPGVMGLPETTEPQSMNQNMIFPQDLYLETSQEELLKIFISDYD